MMDSWKICLSWKDESSSWHHPSEAKNSYPIELAEYAVVIEGK
jgi:hypothetical protein